MGPPIIPGKGVTERSLPPSRGMICENLNPAASLSLSLSLSRLTGGISRLFPDLLLFIRPSSASRPALTAEFTRTPSLVLHLSLYAVSLLPSPI